MKKICFIALFALLLPSLSFQKVFALSCLEPSPPEVAIHEYDVVVIGTVTKMKDRTFLGGFFGNGYDLGKGAVVEADVSLSFKGYNSNKITFTEDLYWGESQVGTEYLLFLNKEGTSFESPLCSPTTETGGLDMDRLIETLSAESTSVMAFEKTDEISVSKSANEPTFYIIIFIFLIIISIFTRIFLLKR